LVRQIVLGETASYLTPKASGKSVDGRFVASPPADWLSEGA
jgi:hypothetical protein